MKIVYVYDAIARIGGVEKILADKMNYFADVCAYDIYLITAAQGNHPFSFPISARVKHIDLNARFHLQYQYKAPLRWWMKWRLDCDFERKIKKQIAQIDPDIIIATTYYKADVVCRLECRAKKIIESHCVKSHTGINVGIANQDASATFCQFNTHAFVYSTPSAVTPVVGSTKPMINAAT